MKMNYTFEAYYQSKNGTPHQHVDLDCLYDIVGIALADSIIIKAADRMIAKKLPQVKAFFEHGGRQVIVADLTNRGNVYIEAVEKA
jgi:hypothetical protein